MVLKNLVITHRRINWMLYLISHTKRNSKCIKYFNVRLERHSGEVHPRGGKTEDRAGWRPCYRFGQQEDGLRGGGQRSRLQIGKGQDSGCQNHR